MGLWLKHDGELVEVGGAPGTDGTDGADGTDGTDGNVWHVGSGEPDPTLGEPGDYYLDGEAGWVYVKRSNSAWTNLYVNLIGPPGEGSGEHDHDYALPHDHPYSPTSHTHGYSPTSHTHDKVGGLGLAGVSVPPSGAQIVRSGTNGYTYVGWLNTVSGANTNEPTRIYTNSGGSDSFVRYMTPANFRAKVTDGRYLPLSGGTVTGNTTFNTEVYSKKWFRSSNTNTGVYNEKHKTGVFTNQDGFYKTYPEGSCKFIAHQFFQNDSVASSTTSGFNNIMRANSLGHFVRNTSTRTLKENIETIDKAWALEQLGRMRPVSFIANREGFGDQDLRSVEDPGLKSIREGDIEYGFIAEEIAELDPEVKLAKYDPTPEPFTPIGWKESNVTALLVAAIQEQRDQIAALTERIEALDA